MIASDTFRATAEQFASTGVLGVREALEKGLAALETANAHSRHNLEAVAASVSAVARGFETLGAHAAETARKAVDEQSDTLRALGSASTVQEALELQQTLARSGMELCMGQFARTSEILATAFQESLRPLNDRLAATVEAVQSSR